MADEGDLLQQHLPDYGHRGDSLQPEESKVDLGEVSQLQSEINVPDAEVREIILSQDGASNEGHSFFGSGLQQVDLNLSQEGRECPECAICGDKGSGYHYSVYSCEGCKGFFKRSVQKNLNYTCKDQMKCNVNKFTRNNCQYCRFKKCLEAGMKRDAVREDRTPGGKQKSKRIKVDDENIAYTDVISSGSESYDEESIQKLVEARPDVIPSAEDILATSETEGVSIDINTLMQYGYMELRLIIEWARKIPGFSDLTIEDQMALLKGSFMELNVLRLAFRSVDCDDGVRFADGLILSPADSSNIGWGKDLVSCTMEFITKLREINLDHTEFCILNAIVLTYPDANGVKNKETIISLQSRILNCLRQYTNQSYPNEPRRYGRILLRLPALRTVSAIAAERFLSMSLDGNIKMNALVLEMMT